MAFSAEQLEILDRGQIDLGIIVFIGTPEPVRIWSGAGDIVIPADTIDEDGGTYQGASKLIDVPAFQGLMNGLAEQITVPLNGVNDEMVALAIEESALVDGASVVIGIVIFDENLQSVGGAQWRWHGTGEVIQWSYDGTNLEAPSKSLTFTAGSEWASRRRPSDGTFTDPCHQIDNPGDRFCERTPLYTRQISKIWGPR